MMPTPVNSPGKCLKNSVARRLSTSASVVKIIAAGTVERSTGGLNTIRSRIKLALLMECIPIFGPEMDESFAPRKDRRRIFNPPFSSSAASDVLPVSIGTR